MQVEPCLLPYLFFKNFRGGLECQIIEKAQKELSKFIEEKIGNFEEEDKGELFEILKKYNLKKE